MAGRLERQGERDGWGEEESRLGGDAPAWRKRGFPEYQSARGNVTPAVDRGGDVARSRRFGYDAPGRSMAYLVFPVFGVASVVIIVTAIANGEPPLAFALLWTAGAAWVGYWFCWQIGHSVAVCDGTVTWRTVLRSRTVPLAAVTGINTVWIGFQRITVREGRSMFVSGSGRGWVRFLARMQFETGSEGFEASAADRFFSWMPEITGGYHESDD